MLLRIRTFIKQCFLDDKLTKDFPELVDISFTAWHLINAIYEFSWDRLSVDKSNKSFWQYILPISLEISQQFLKFSNQTLLPIYLSQTKVNQLNPSITRSHMYRLQRLISKSSPVRSKVNITTKRPLLWQPLDTKSNSSTRQQIS